MDDYDEFPSDISMESDDDENFLCQVNFEVANNNNNNNDSFSKPKALSTQQVLGMMKHEIERVCETTNVSECQVVNLVSNLILHLGFQLAEAKARSLLDLYKWDSIKLLETIYDGGEKARVLLMDSWERVDVDMEKFLDCEVCFDTVVGPGQIHAFPCNHRFCLSCLSTYVATIIKESGGLLATAIRCPGEKCVYEIGDEFVFELLRDSSLKAKYQKILANCFVEVTLPFYLLDDP